MQTQLPESLLSTADGQAADKILRACVHCGFCTAVCPTYRLLGNELDSPRGRIYLIKAALEHENSGDQTRTHLERCLGCRACETVCPSQVDYHHLLDIGKESLDHENPAPMANRYFQRLLLSVLGSRNLFAALVKIGQLFRPLMPKKIAGLVPPKEQAGNWPPARHNQKVLVLEGCVQEAMAPASNAALARILDRASLSAESERGCCGALHQHSGAPERALSIARANVDRWSERLQHFEMLVIAATGCAAHTRDYAWVLRADAAYLEKWRAIEQRVLEASELLNEQFVDGLIERCGLNVREERIAFHTPCSLQHGLKRGGLIERLLRRCGYELADVPEQGMCCGSAGTYSLRQPTLAGQLRDARLSALEQTGPNIISTANVGCQHHLQSGTETPVEHWLEAVDAALGSPPENARHR